MGGVRRVQRLPRLADIRRQAAVGTHRGRRDRHRRQVAGDRRLLRPARRGQYRGMLSRYIMVLRSLSRLIRPALHTLIPSPPKLRSRRAACRAASPARSQHEYSTAAKGPRLDLTPLLVGEGERGSTRRKRRKRRYTEKESETRQRRGLVVSIKGVKDIAIARFPLVESGAGTYTGHDDRAGGAGAFRI